MLLLHPDLRKTMTEQDLKKEQESGLCPNKIKCCFSSTNSRPDIDLPAMNNSIFNSDNTNKTKQFLQFQGSTASNCLQKIVQEHDFEQACEKIIQEKNHSGLLLKQIFSIPRSTAAQLVINGKTHTLGEDLRDFVQQM
jgi:hypothetical protein